ncbi:MAG TPA: DUF4399 domain-containing protein [Lichenihabitans sp.]|jgi:hypothetical protein|nr:DUF4399 domain-containing protein [Lichenihabitans sp.]
MERVGTIMRHVRLVPVFALSMIALFCATVGWASPDHGRIPAVGSGEKIQAGIAAGTPVRLAQTPAAADTTGQTPARSPSAPGAEVYFIDLADGATVPETFDVRIGLRHMGVAPAGVDFPNAGHHHIIVDSDLPPFDREIPADLDHIHLGAGETERMITLPPGEHTLQLLMADANHISFDPPVFSKKIHITVVANATAAAAAAPPGAPAPPAAPLPAPAPPAPPQPEEAPLQRHKSPKEAAVYVVSPRDGAVVGPKFLVEFGLTGMGVAPASVDRQNTGHHHLLIDTEVPKPDEIIPADFNHIHYGDGQTEGWVTLPPGKHTLQLVFGDSSHMQFDPPVMSKPITVTVRAAKKGRK